MSPQTLVDALREVPATSYVRVVAHWLARAGDLEQEPPRVGDPLIDVLAAAASAHRAQMLGVAIPAWTNSRELDSFWHPGADAFFAYALAHSPQAFFNRGILIEADSLVSV